jgi:xylulokinase
MADPGSPASCALAIDLGTSGPKVGLVTKTGEVRGVEFEPVETMFVPGGGAEQRPDDWWRAVAAASRRLLAAHPDERVVVVGTTAQWAGTVAIDREGRAVCPAVIWMDARGAPYVRRRAGGRVTVAGYDPRRLARWVWRTGGAPSLSGRDPFGHLLWLRAERPRAFAAAACFLEPADFLGLKLSGRVATTAATATLHWVTDTRDLARVRYDDELLRVAGLRRDQLPPLLGVNTVLGRLTEPARYALGLPVAVPVVAGSPDTMAAAVGSGAVRDGAAHLYVGTSAWLSCHVRYKRTDPLHSVASLPAAVPGRRLVSCEQETAGISLERLRDALLPGTGAAGFAELERLAAGAAPGSGGVLYTPWLNGERTPVDDPDVRGALHNLTLSTTREQIARAVLEGVALNARWMQQAVERFCRARLEPIAFVGGGARSALWAQIMADVLGRTVDRVGAPTSVGVRGAGLLALLGIGEIGLHELDARAPIVATHHPDPARERYDAMFTAFRRIYRAERRIRPALAAVRDFEKVPR